MTEAELDAVFRALGDPTRRALLARLAEGECSTGVLAGDFSLSRPTISKHLGVLRRVGLVTGRPEGRRWFYRLEPEPLRLADRWLSEYRSFWQQGLGRLRRHVEESS